MIMAAMVRGCGGRHRPGVWWSTAITQLRSSGKGPPPGYALRLIS